MKHLLLKFTGVIGEIEELSRELETIQREKSEALQGNAVANVIKQSVLIVILILILMSPGEQILKSLF